MFSKTVFEAETMDKFAFIRNQLQTGLQGLHVWCRAARAQTMPAVWPSFRQAFGLWFGLFYQATAQENCLPDAVNASERRNLTSAKFGSYPIGLWTGNWAASLLVTSVTRILLEDRALMNLLFCVHYTCCFGCYPHYYRHFCHDCYLRLLSAY